MNKIQLYGYEDILDAVVDAVKEFKDPLKDDTPLLYDGNVYPAFPGRERIGLHSGIMAVVSINNLPSISGIGEEVATFTGELYTSIPGTDEDSIKRCLRYCDIARGYFQSFNILDLTNTCTKVPERNINTFSSLDLSKVYGTKQPIHVRAGLTSFVVEKTLDDTYYEI